MVLRICIAQLNEQYFFLCIITIIILDLEKCRSNAYREFYFCSMSSKTIVNHWSWIIILLVLGSRMFAPIAYYYLLYKRQMRNIGNYTWMQMPSKNNLELQGNKSVLLQLRIRFRNKYAPTGYVEKNKSIVHGFF